MSKNSQESSEHPTRTLIVSVAAQVLKERGPNGFRVDDVLERTGLTRGAIYHHFINVDDLTEAALLATYSEAVDATVHLVRGVLAAATTFEQFRTGVFQVNTQYVHNDELRVLRKLRAHTMAIATPPMAGLLAAEQQRLTEEYASMIMAAQDRGWVRTDLDPWALAVFIQAYSFGAIVDDIAVSHVDVDRWAELIEDFLDRAVFTNPN
jgi:AcrR family transcriptional regulator